MRHTSFQPVFVVGFPRSGTTLLASQLMRHGNVAIPPETRFFEEVMPPFNIGLTTHASLVRKFQGNFRCKDLQLDSQILLNRFMDYEASYANLLRVALEMFAVMHGRTLVGEKTPVHMMYVDTILAWYPEAKIVAIVRDGRDSVLSLLRVPWAHHDLARHCADWIGRMNHLRRLLKRYPEQMHLVRYEELLRQPDTVLKEVLSFAGIPVLEEPDGSEVPVLVPTWESGWKGNADKALDPSRIAAWRHSASTEQICCMQTMMGRGLREWGYDDALPTQCRGWLRIKYILLRIIYCSWLYRGARSLVLWARRFRGRFPDPQGAGER